MATRSAATGRSAAAGLNLGGCLRFNGTSSLVSIPDNAAYSWATASALSVSFWINPDVLINMPNEEGGGGDRFVVLLCKQGSGTNEWQFRMYTQDNTVARANRISFYTFAAAGGLGDGVAVQDNIVAGQWIHLVATVDGSKVMRLYKDSIQRDQFTSTVVMTDTASAVTVGAGHSNSASVTSYFQGMIDDVQIFNRVITQAEIRQLFLTGRGLTGGLVGWWKFNDGSGSTAVDSSVTANNGSITSPIWVTHAVQGRQPVDPPGDNAYISSSVTAAVFPQARPQIRPEGTNVIRFNGTADKATNATYIFPVNAHSMAFWVKFSKFVTNDRLFDQQDAGPANGVAASVTSAAGVNTLSFIVRNAGSNVSSVVTQTLQANVWYHIVESYLSTGKQYLFVNGIEVATHNGAAGTAPTGAFTIGSRTGAASNFFGGELREMLFYSRQLTTLEVQALYFNGVVPQGSLDAGYTFDSVATDFSTNGRTLTLTGTTYVTDPPKKARAAT